jgi:tetratricopeptide (TPR) repeat protein
MRCVVLSLAIAVSSSAFSQPRLTGEAQESFQRGLDLYFGYHYERAIEAFEKAARLAPRSSRPHWGIALALGPSLNGPDVTARMPHAYAAAERALKLAKAESPREQDYARALTSRYSGDPTFNADALNQRYVQAMGGLFERYRDDSDVAVLFADSLIVAAKGAVWRADGTPSPDTKRALGIVEGVLRRQPHHVGANHLHVHIVENSPTPARALSSARRLETLVPDAGHLLHMPSHIYLRLGDYRRAVAVNQRAFAADKTHPAHDTAGTDAGLQAHTSEFLAAAASFTGQSAVARAANDNAFVLMRFGLWNEILARPVPDNTYGRLEMRIARVLALIATARLTEVRAELQAYEDAERAMPAGATWWADPLERFTPMVRNEMAARLAWAQGSRALAIDHWRTAVDAQDRLTRAESVLPWFHPLRESLGSALYQAGQFAEAERTFRADLEINPGNPRSLFGLWHTLVALKRDDEAASIRKQFEGGWSDADVPLAINDL